MKELGLNEEQAGWVFDPEDVDHCKNEEEGDE